MDSSQKIQWLLCTLVTQSCPTLFQPHDCSPPGSPVHGILQVRILQWVSMPSSRGSSGPRDRTHLTSSALAGRFFTSSGTWEAPPSWGTYNKWMSPSLQMTQPSRQNFPIPSFHVKQEKPVTLSVLWDSPIQMWAKLKWGSDTYMHTHTHTACTCWKHKEKWGQP